MSGVWRLLCSHCARGRGQRGFVRLLPGVAYGIADNVTTSVVVVTEVEARRTDCQRCGGRLARYAVWCPSTGGVE